MSKKPASRTRSAEKFPVRFSSVTGGISSARKTRRPLRGTRSALFPGGSGGRSIPSTPLLQWKFEEVSHGGERQPNPGGAILRQPRKTAGVPPHAVSVRRLTAAIWNPWIPKLLVEGEMCSALKNKGADLYDNPKNQENQKITTLYIVSALRSELELACSRVSELETERKSFNKKLDCFIRRVEEENVSWRRKEHAKILSIVEEMQFDLNRERKRSHKLKKLNSKLLNELTASKLSAKQILREYEKQRKAREITSEVFNEMANEIGDEKAEIEAMKAESAKNREQVEEERKMMQFAEVWREERVQMKLIDAKIALEVKYSQASMLEEEIEEFLRSRIENQYDVSEIEQAESLKQAIETAQNHGIVQFLQGIEEQCHGTLFLQGDSERPMKRYDNIMFDGNCGAEEQGSSKSPDGSEPSVNGRFVKSRASVCGAEGERICSAATGRPRKKGSSMSRLWKSSRASKAGDFKKISFESTQESSEQGLMGKLMEEGIQIQGLQIRQILREKI